MLYLITMKVSIIILTWQRLQSLGTTLESLERQTFKDFDVYISNGNMSRQTKVNKYYNMFKQRLKLHLSHDGNDSWSFRRMFVAKKALEQGAEVILFIDDDVTIPDNYVENCLSQYEPKTYKSGYAWYFTKNTSYYNGRVRVANEKDPVHYAGTGIAMIDASIFLEEGLLNAPACAYKIEDLWLSYYANHVLGWKLGWIKDSGARVFGKDNVALNREVKRSNCNKDNFFSYLTLERGWTLTT